MKYKLWLLLVVVLLAGCDKDDTGVTNDCTAFMMVDFVPSNSIKDLQNSINPDELYNDGPLHPGVVNKLHVTLADYLDRNISIEELRPYLMELSAYKITLTGMTKFTGKSRTGTPYDILVAIVDGEAFNKTNQLIMSNFRNNSKKAYEPHMTIAYLKAGCADKYISSEPFPPVELNPVSFFYSYTDEKGNIQEFHFGDTDD